MRVKLIILLLIDGRDNNLIYKKGANFSSFFYALLSITVNDKYYFLFLFLSLLAVVVGT